MIETLALYTSTSYQYILGIPNLLTIYALWQKPNTSHILQTKIENQSQFTHDRDISALNIDLIPEHTAYFQICQLHALWQKPHTSQILHTKIQNHSQFTHDRDISALNIELIPEHTRHPKFVNNMLYAKIRILRIFCIPKFKISRSSHMTEALALQTSTSYQCILHTPKFVNYMLFGQTRILRILCIPN